MQTEIKLHLNYANKQRLIVPLATVKLPFKVNCADTGHPQTTASRSGNGDDSQCRCLSSSRLHTHTHTHIYINAIFIDMGNGIVSLIFAGVSNVTEDQANTLTNIQKQRAIHILYTIHIYVYIYTYIGIYLYFDRLFF